MSSSEVSILLEPTITPSHQPVGEAFRALKGRKFVTLCTVFVVWTLTNVDQSLFGYAVPSILAEFHASLDAVGVILSVGFGLAIVSCIIIGLLADRFGRRMMLAVSLALSGTVVGLQSLAPTLLTLGAARAIAFALSGGISPIANAIYAETAPTRIRGLLIGVLQCGYPLGWFFASLLAVPLMQSFGWRSIFALGFAVVPLSLLCYWLIPESAAFLGTRAVRKRSDWRAQLRELFLTKRSRQTWLIGLAFFAHSGAYAGSAYYLPTFLHAVRGYDMSTATSIIGHSYATGIIGYIAVSIIGEFLLSRRTTIIIWCFSAALALGGMIWLPTTPGADSFWCGLTAIFFYGIYAILATYLLELFPTWLRVTGAATGTAFSCLGFALYPVIVARGVAWMGWQPAFTVFLIPTLLVCGIAVLGLRDIPSGQPIEDL